jgi:uncharacterized protein (TIGR02246 family)
MRVSIFAFGEPGAKGNLTMKRLPRFLFLIGAVGIMIGVSAQAGDADRSTDEQSIRQSAQAFAKAYSVGDAKAIANQFLSDGEYIDEFKNIFKGREAIEKEFAAFFKQSPGNKIAILVQTSRDVENQRVGVFTASASIQLAWSDGGS